MVDSEHGGKGWNILPPPPTGRVPYYFEQMGPDYGDRNATRVLPSVTPKAGLGYGANVLQDRSGRLFAVGTSLVAHTSSEGGALLFDPNARGVFPDEAPQPLYSPFSSAQTEELPRILASETQVFPTYELLWSLGGVRNRWRAVKEYVGVQAALCKEDAQVLLEDIRLGAQALLGMLRYTRDNSWDQQYTASWEDGFDMPEWNGPITETMLARRSITGRNGERIYYSLPD